MFTRRFARRAAALAAAALAFPSLAQMPPDYVAAAEQMAEPLYREREFRPAPTLGNALSRDGAAILKLAGIKTPDDDLLRMGGAFLNQMSEGSFYLLAIAGIDKVEPDKAQVLKNALGGLFGDQAAQKKFDDTIGGVILAEATKFAFRVAYRESLVARRNSAMELWKVAQKHAGPVLTESRAGVGVRVQEQNGQVVVASVVEGGSAALAGVRGGERIVAVEGKAITGGLAEVLRLLPGAPGSDVAVTVRSAAGKDRVLRMRRGTTIPVNVLNIDMNSSWGGAYANDVLHLWNASGRVLNNVTLVVQLRHGNGFINHVHFTKSWQPGELRRGFYHHESAYRAQETLDHVSEVRLWLYSDEARYETTYAYAGAELEADVAEWFNRLKFTGGLVAPHDGVFVDKPAGFKASFTGLTQIRPNAVTVTYDVGGRKKSVRYTFDEAWQSQGFSREKEFRHESFNGARPSRVTMAFEFPGVREPREVWWDIK